jgi:fluoride exporter
MSLLAVVLAGAVGAGSRFVVDHAVTRLTARVMPLGTLVVNVTGSAAAGVLAGLAARHGLDETVRLAAGTGFLAAFTTYSTFAVETVRLVERHARTAVLNAVASLVLSAGTAGIGYAMLVAT